MQVYKTLRGPPEEYLADKHYALRGFGPGVASCFSLPLACCLGAATDTDLRFQMICLKKNKLNASFVYIAIVLTQIDRTLIE
jgi:hypothetical protein